MRRCRVSRAMRLKTLIVCTAAALLAACENAPPPDEAPARATEISPKDPGSEESSAGIPDEALLRDLASRTLVTFVGRVLSEAEGEGRFPQSREREPMRILQVAVEESLKGRIDSRVTIVEPAERERVAPGGRVLLYVKSVDGRWFNAGSFAVTDDRIPELALSLDRVRALHREPGGPR